MIKLETVVQFIKKFETPIRHVNTTEAEEKLRHYRSLGMCRQYLDLKSEMTAQKSYDARKKDFILIREPFSDLHLGHVDVLNNSKIDKILYRLGNRKTLHSIPLRRFGGDIPKAILERADEFKTEVDEERVLVFGNKAMADNLVLGNPLQVDPALVGTWYRNSQSNSCGRPNPFNDRSIEKCYECFDSGYIGHRMVRPQCLCAQTINEPYTALLGHWDEDINEIDAQFPRNLSEFVSP